MLVHVVEVTDDSPAPHLYQCNRGVRIVTVEKLEDAYVFEGEEEANTILDLMEAHHLQYGFELRRVNIAKLRENGEHQALSIANPPKRKRVPDAWEKGQEPSKPNE